MLDYINLFNLYYFLSSERAMARTCLCPGQSNMLLQNKVKLLVINRTYENLTGLPLAAEIYLKFATAEINKSYCCLMRAETW